MLGCHVELVFIDEDGGNAAQIKWPDEDEQCTRHQILVAPVRTVTAASRRGRAGEATTISVFSAATISITSVLWFTSERGKVADKYQAYTKARAEGWWIAIGHIENVAKTLIEHGTITGDISTVFPQRAVPAVLKLLNQ
jgi:hypothetical protein